AGSADLRLIYLQGLEKDDATPQWIIPTTVSTSHSHERIQQFMKFCCPSDEPAASPELKILLAIVESDSTIVYYKLTDGFVMPDPPDIDEFASSKRKRKRVRLTR
uniref:tRNA-splicing endonuclease subunit Sen15 domain-containing protein n=1 Tax=Leptobrachium leishanense TaxID=445787 RepID=A0A8C5PCJ8_9ANUR